MRSQSRWYQRVLPVTVLATALVGLAALLVPAVRDQIELSATHRPEPYVALYFSRTTTGQLVCAGDGDTTRVAVTVESHLAHAAQVRWIIGVGPAGGQRLTAVRRGTLALDAGETADLVRRLPRAARAQAVRVVLPDLGQGLRAHCPAVAAGAR